MPICRDPLRLLWVQRNGDAPALGGFHVGPGGVLDDGEAPEPASLRELFEEVGILHAEGAERIDDDTVEALRAAFLSDAEE
ncbi:MAG: NUDIX domain-containing protein, partial [Sandaracinaceae bacterium]